MLNKKNLYKLMQHELRRLGVSDTPGKVALVLSAVVVVLVEGIQALVQLRRGAGAQCSVGRRRARATANHTVGGSDYVTHREAVADGGGARVRRVEANLVDMTNARREVVKATI